MESDWIDNKCKSGQTIFIYNKVTEVHKWPPGFNNGSSEDCIMHGQPVEYKISHSIATQTDDYGCNNGCTSMYINTDPHHVSNISETLLSPQPGVSVDDEHDLDNEHEPENTLEDEQEQSQNMDEIFSIPSMLEKDAFYPGYTNLVKTKKTLLQPQPGVSVDGAHDLENEHDPENTLENNQEKNQDTDEFNTMLSVVEELEFPPGNNLVEKENEGKYDSAGDDNTEKRQLDEREGCSSKHSQKSLKCSYCSKQFIHRSKLTQHIRIHTGEKPFECSFCEKMFANKGDLKKHLRTHTGEKPFGCSFCKKTFVQNSNFNKHLRIHTGEKNFECSYCEKKFAERGDLKRHLRIHTREKSFECSHCKKKFTQRSSLKKHLTLH